MRAANPAILLSTGLLCLFVATSKRAQVSPTALSLVTLGLHETQDYWETSDFVPWFKNCQYLGVSKCDVASPLDGFW